MNRLPPLLYSALEKDGLVPFAPEHWRAMRTLCPDPHALAEADDALSVTLGMTALARTVIVDDAPVCLIGMHLIPEGGSPWVFAPLLTTDQLARVVLASQPFVMECLERCAFLQSDVEHHEGISLLWFAALGFQNVSEGPVARWELRRRDVGG